MTVIVSLFLQYDLWEKRERILPDALKNRHVSNYFQFRTCLLRKHRDCSLKFILTLNLFFNLDDFVFFFP